MDAMTRILIRSTIFIVVMVAIANIWPTGAPETTSRPPAAASSAYSHDALEADADMTRRMSTQNANADAPYHANDGQLARSQDPGYVAALEQHVEGLDQMLARGDR